MADPCHQRRRQQEHLRNALAAKHLHHIGTAKRLLQNHLSPTEKGEGEKREAALVKQRAEEQQRIVASVGVIAVLEGEYLRHESLIAVAHRFGSARRTAREQHKRALIPGRLVNARSVAESQDRGVVPEHAPFRKGNHRPR